MVYLFGWIMCEYGGVLKYDFKNKQYKWFGNEHILLIHNWEEHPVLTGLQIVIQWLSMRKFVLVVLWTEKILTDPKKIPIGNHCNTSYRSVKTDYSSCTVITWDTYRRSTSRKGMHKNAPKTSKANILTNGTMHLSAVHTTVITNTSLLNSFL